MCTGICHVHNYILTLNLYFWIMTSSCNYLEILTYTWPLRAAWWRGVSFSLSAQLIFTFRRLLQIENIKHFRHSMVNYVKFSGVLVFIQQLSIDLQVQYQYTIHTITTESLQFNYIVIYMQRTPWKICTSICSFTYHDRKWIT